MKKKQVLTIVLLLLISCTETPVKVPGLVYKSSVTIGVWIGENKIDFSEINKTRKEGSGNIIFDTVTSELWLAYKSSDNQEVYLYNVIDGVVKTNEYITITFDKGVNNHSYILHNNKLFVRYLLEDNLDILDCEIYDLITGERKYIVLDLKNDYEIDSSYVMRWFNGKEIIFLIFGDDKDSYGVSAIGYIGLYDIETKELEVRNFRSDLVNWYYNPKENKILTYSEKTNTIVVYDVTAGNYMETTMYRKYLHQVPWASFYYYLDGNYLYYSQPTEEPGHYIFSRLMLGVQPLKIWYRCDLTTTKKERIYSPDKLAEIIGRVNQ